MAKERKKPLWMRLDNAAKIYPAARTNSWSNIFRLSATLSEDVDKEVLESALAVTAKRFPSIAARLRRGAFWYYLEELPYGIEIKDEASYPVTKMSKRETRKCAIRVIVYKKRIAVEFFHAVTDGTGGIIFLKTLLAEYLEQKYGISVPAEDGVLDRRQEPRPEELEDSFGKYAGQKKASRGGSRAWRLSGTPEENGFLDLTCFKMNVKDVLDAAHAHGVSVTVFLCAALMEAICACMREKSGNAQKKRPVKVLVPVNLRNLFPSGTLRNFSFYSIPEILPYLGEYDFDEICSAIVHKMGAEANPKFMSMNIATNVGSERLAIVRLMPLFIKNFVMKAVYNAVGERTSCMTFSNLGRIELPEPMREYVERFDFILSVQSSTPFNCSAVSYGDTLFFNFIRGVKESRLEYHFHRALLSQGIVCEVESNNSCK